MAGRPRPDAVAVAAARRAERWQQLAVLFDGVRPTGRWTISSGGRRTVDAGFVDRSDRVLVSEDRICRQLRHPGGTSYAVAEWVVHLHANPLPDAWLLGLLATSIRSSRGVPSWLAQRT